MGTGLESKRRAFADFLRFGDTPAAGSGGNSPPLPTSFTGCVRAAGELAPRRLGEGLEGLLSAAPRASSRRSLALMQPTSIDGTRWRWWVIPDGGGGG